MSSAGVAISADLVCVPSRTWKPGERGTKPRSMDASIGDVDACDEPPPKEPHDAFASSLTKFTRLTVWALPVTLTYQASPKH